MIHAAAGSAGARGIAQEPIGRLAAHRAICQDRPVLLLRVTVSLAIPGAWLVERGLDITDLEEISRPLVHVFYCR